MYKKTKKYSGFGYKNARKYKYKIIKCNGKLFLNRSHKRTISEFLMEIRFKKAANISRNPGIEVKLISKIS